MATLNQDSYTSLGTASGGALLRLEVTVASGALTGLQVHARQSETRPYSLLTDAATWQVGDEAMLSYSITDGSLDAARVKGGQKLTAYIRVFEYTSVDIRAAGTGNTTAVVTAVNSSGGGAGVTYVNDSSGNPVGIAGPGGTLGVLPYVVLPSGDTTGVTDRLSIAAAIAAAGARGGGDVVLYPGQYYTAATDVATTNTDRGIPMASNVTVRGLGRRASRIRVVGGSRCNIFCAYDVNNWAIENLYLDGNRTDPAMPPTGGSLDAVRNCIAMARCNNWRIDDCTLTRAAYHGFIGVGAAENMAITNNDMFENGFRAAHLHEEGGIPGKITFTGNRVRANGQSHFTGMVTTAQVQAGALTKLRLSADAAAKLNLNASEGITSCTISIPTAGTSGSTLLTTATLSATNPDANFDLTFLAPATQATAAVSCRLMTGGTSGVFLVFGTNDVLINNVEIYDELGMGLHLSGSPNVPSVGRVIVSNTLVSGCAQGMGVGAVSSGAAISDVMCTGLKILNSTFHGVNMGNVTNFVFDGEIGGSGAAGLTFVAASNQDYIRLSGVIRDNGAVGVFARGSGEVAALHIDADLVNNGKNPGFLIGTQTFMGADAVGWGMGAKVSAEAANKYHSVVVDSGVVSRNAGGGVHVTNVDHAVVSVRNCIDNCPATGTGTSIAIRLVNCLSGSIQNADVLLQSRTNSNYAISASSCTNVAIRGNRTNYTRASNVVYLDGAGCVAYDNVIPSGTAVQYANGAAAASNAALQRTA